MDLLDAVVIGDIHLIESILDKNVSIESSDNFGRTALHLACLERHTDVVKLLVTKYHASPSSVDSFGNQPIKEAISLGFSEVVELLTQAGARLSDEGRKNVQYEMCRCGAEGNLEILKGYVQCGMSVNASDYGKRTILHLASANGHLEVVKFLIKNGADVEVRDRLGRTAMDDAKESGNFLIQHELARIASVPAEDEPELHVGAGELRWIESFFRVDKQGCGWPLDNNARENLSGGVTDPMNSAAASRKRSCNGLSSSPFVVAKLKVPPNARDLPLARYGKTYKHDTHADATALRRCASEVGTLEQDAALSGPSRYQARTLARATVVSIDIKGFTERCATMSAGAAGAWVADFYARVDRAAAECGVRKADVRGDCCICVAVDCEGGGVAVPPQLSSQATRALAFAAAVHAELAGACGGGGGGGSISARMGIATGPVAFLAGDAATRFAGVQGEAVAAAARMEALGRPGMAVVHETAAEQWAAETGRAAPRTTCCRSGKGGGGGLERAAAYDCVSRGFADGPAAAEVLPEAGLRSLGRGEWPALLRRAGLLLPDGPGRCAPSHPCPPPVPAFSASPPPRMQRSAS